MGCCGGNGNGDSSGEDDKNNDDGGDGNGGAIDVYYDAGGDSDDAGVFVAAARAAVNAAAVAPADQGDNDAGCNEDPSACAFPAAATATSLLPVAGAMPWQRAGPPLLGVVTYFSSSSDNKDKDKDKDDAIDNSDVVGQEVGQR